MYLRLQLLQGQPRNQIIGDVPLSTSYQFLELPVLLFRADGLPHFLRNDPRRNVTWRISSNTKIISYDSWRRLH